MGGSEDGQENGWETSGGGSFKLGASPLSETTPSAKVTREVREPGWGRSAAGGRGGGISSTVSVVNA